jgi:hypothetical protein
LPKIVRINILRTLDNNKKVYRNMENICARKCWLLLRTVLRDILT